MRRTWENSSARSGQDQTPRLREARLGYSQTHFAAYRRSALRCTTKWGVALGAVAAAALVWVLLESFLGV